MVFDNRFTYGLRKEFGRWRQTVAVQIALEQELLDENRVFLDGEGRTVVHFERHSSYADLGVEQTFAMLPKVLAPLPIETITYRGRRPTESHVQGTVRMGKTRADSVIDGALVHHDVRNLVVAGTSALPTCPAVAPSLTAAAMSLRSADLVMG